MSSVSILLPFARSNFIEPFCDFVANTALCPEAGMILVSSDLIDVALIILFAARLLAYRETNLSDLIICAMIIFGNLSRSIHGYSYAAARISLSCQNFPSASLCAKQMRFVCQVSADGIQADKFILCLRFGRALERY